LRALVTAGAGFLLAVLWFDLMFDVQVVRGGGTEAVDSIARYYRRVTTEARPMNRLIALVMLATLGGLVAEVVGDDVPQWVAIASLALAVVAIGVAATRTVPRAVRLGTQADSGADQLAAAHMILREHLVCLACIVTLLGLQLIFG
jgi:hypothetical protein